jgi:hypothetical protein
MLQKKNSLKGPYPRVCVECGQDFWSPRPHSVCCRDPECRKAHRDKLFKKNYAATKDKKTGIPCLKCENRFMPQGRFNRICPTCKNTDLFQGSIYFAEATHRFYYTR